jgi:hypothetical protein
LKILIEKSKSAHFSALPEAIEICLIIPLLVIRLIFFKKN